MPVHIERTAYKGWSNCWRVSNGAIELVVTADVGPRVIYLGFNGGQNVFKNFPEQMGRSGEAEWMIRGGSRIWIAPEDVRASYAPDNCPVEIEIEGAVLTATAPVEDPIRVQKQMVVKVSPAAARVEVIHRIRNAGLLPVELAPWILTVMAPGGVGITGFPPRGTHPETLPPTNPLVMWAFTDLSDRRWVFMKKYLALKQDATAKTPQKIGHFNPRTWGAYLLNGELFLKRCEGFPRQEYPDFGSSFEMFTNSDFLELETLGPLRLVAPGEWVEHVEQWELHRGVEVAEWTDAGLDRTILSVL